MDSVESAIDIVYIDNINGVVITALLLAVTLFPSLLDSWNCTKVLVKIF
jgi:hypothetical protein